MPSRFLLKTGPSLKDRFWSACRCSSSFGSKWRTQAFDWLCLQFSEPILRPGFWRLDPLIVTTKRDIRRAFNKMNHSITSILLRLAIKWKSTGRRRANSLGALSTTVIYAAMLQLSRRHQCALRRLCRWLLLTTIPSPWMKTSISGLSPNVRKP